MRFRLINVTRPTLEDKGHGLDVILRLNVAMLTVIIKNINVDGTEYTVVCSITFFKKKYIQVPPPIYLFRYLKMGSFCIITDFDITSSFF